MEEWLTADQDLTGVQEVSDGEIIDLVKESTSPQDDTDEEEEMERAVSHSDAKQCFDTCLKWLEQQQEATPMNLMLLGHLHTIASRKRHSSLKQRKITSFCNHKNHHLFLTLFEFFFSCLNCMYKKYLKFKGYDEIVQSYVHFTVTYTLFPKGYVTMRFYCIYTSYMNHCNNDKMLCLNQKKVSAGKFAKLLYSTL